MSDNFKASRAGIGVIVVTYQSADVIGECLTSLLASDYPDLFVVVCDNASHDQSVDEAQSAARQAGASLCIMSERDEPADGQIPAHKVTIIKLDANYGYAGGVNRGLRFFERYADIDLFWILNPDCVVRPDAAGAYAAAADRAGQFGLMAGRTLYADGDLRIQSDGGHVNLWTGVCKNVNQGKDPSKVNMPCSSRINFLSGANLVASRAYVQSVGPMPEDYFLYYEEVDWALRRNGLPLVLVPEAVVMHHAGTAIGSGTADRLPSAFSNYFNYRNRMLFMRRHNPLGLPFAYAYSMARIARLLLQGAPGSAFGAFCGLHFLPPPRSVSSRIEQAAWPLAFGRRPRS